MREEEGIEKAAARGGGDGSGGSDDGGGHGGETGAVATYVQSERPRSVACCALPWNGTEADTGIPSGTGRRRRRSRRDKTRRNDDDDDENVNDSDSRGYRLTSRLFQPASAGWDGTVAATTGTCE